MTTDQTSEILRLRTVCRGLDSPLGFVPTDDLGTLSTFARWNFQVVGRLHMTEYADKFRLNVLTVCALDLGSEWIRIDSLSGVD